MFDSAVATEMTGSARPTNARTGGGALLTAGPRCGSALTSVLTGTAMVVAVPVALPRETVTQLRRLA